MSHGPTEERFCTFLPQEISTAAWEALIAESPGRVKGPQCIMSALCNPTLPLGFVDEDLGDDLQGLIPGSPFDILLGNQSSALLDLNKVQT